MAMAIRHFGKVFNLAIRLFWPFVGPESKPGTISPRKYFDCINFYGQI